MERLLDIPESISKWLARIFILIVIVVVFKYLMSKRKRKSEPRGDFDSDLDSGSGSSVLPDLANRLLDPMFISSFFSTPGHTGGKRKKRENKTENKCRAILESIYKAPFPSIRPDFLKSPLTGKNLELDCYNSNLNIALEYNGPQHYTYTPVFHKNKRAFYAQVHRDDWKRKRCREMGIRLIEIPHWISEIQLEDYIRKELTRCKCL